MKCTWCIACAGETLSDKHSQLLSQKSVYRPEEPGKPDADSESDADSEGDAEHNMQGASTLMPMQGQAMYSTALSARYCGIRQSSKGGDDALKKN